MKNFFGKIFRWFGAYGQSKAQTNLIRNLLIYGYPREGSSLSGAFVEIKHEESDTIHKVYIGSDARAYGSVDGGKEVPNAFIKDRLRLTVNQWRREARLLEHAKIVQAKRQQEKARVTYLADRRAAHGQRVDLETDLRGQTATFLALDTISHANIPVYVPSSAPSPSCSYDSSSSFSSDSGGGGCD